MKRGKKEEKREKENVGRKKCLEKEAGKEKKERKRRGKEREKREKVMECGKEGKK